MKAQTIRADLLLRRWSWETYRRLSSFEWLGVHQRALCEAFKADQIELGLRVRFVRAVEPWAAADLSPLVWFESALSLSARQVLTRADCMEPQAVLTLDARGRLRKCCDTPRQHREVRIWLALLPREAFEAPYSSVTCARRHDGLSTDLWHARGRALDAVSRLPAFRHLGEQAC